jgi:VanZ family protein
MQLFGLIKQYCKFVLWVLVIGYLCLAPANEFKKVHIAIPYFDKVVHFGLFFILGILIRTKQEIKFAVAFYYFQVFFAALYGGLIEIAQNHLTTSRRGDWIDWGADLAGLAAGIWLVRHLPSKLSRLLA